MEQIQDLIKAQECMISGDYASMLTLVSNAVKLNPYDYYVRRGYAWALALNHRHSFAADNFLLAGMLLAGDKCVFDELLGIANNYYSRRTYAVGEVLFPLPSRKLNDNEGLIVEAFEGHLVMSNKTRSISKFDNYMTWLSRGNYEEI